jgi:FkbM family methyltransferase
MINIPIKFKLLFPNYRSKWLNKCKFIIDHIELLSHHVEFGSDDTDPWIKINDNGFKIYGFWSNKETDEIFDIIYPSLPHSLERKFLRIMVDYISRYVYPHMRPDLYVKGANPSQMFGFHGQHKENIRNIEDPKIRNIFKEIFTPRENDVIINCGAYIGMGDISVSLNIPDGHIFAIEANSECYRLMLKNFTTNNISNATPIHRAVWNDEIEIEMESVYAQKNSIVSDIVQGSYREKVMSITIDTVVTQRKISKVDMLSLTLNGAEIEALIGAAEVLTNLRPRVVLAGWYRRDGKRVCDKAKEILEKFDYYVHIGKRGSVLALPRELVLTSST